LTVTRCCNHLSTTDWLEHHDDTGDACLQVLLLLLNDTPNTRGLLPGKLFEYLGAERPILCIGTEDGDAAQLIRVSGGGTTVDLHDTAKIKETITEYYHQYLGGNLRTSSASQTLRQYARRNIVQHYAELMKEIIKTSKASHK
jgi:hypothetical protein